MEDSPGLVQWDEGGGAGVKMFDQDDHARALEKGEDIPKSLPDFPLEIQQVGIGEKTFWLLLPHGRIPFKGSVTVDLPGRLRGIHMSRIEEEVSRLYDTPFGDPRSYAVALAGAVVERQAGATARVELTGAVPMPRQTPVSGRCSVDSAEARATATVLKGGGIKDSTIGLGVYHITACPCTQAYAKAMRPGAGGDLPMPTHSQRSFTRLEVEVRGEGPGLEDLYQCLDLSLHLTQGLLKRPDEAEVVMKAHAAPQFAEDAVRAVAARLPGLLGSLTGPETRVVVESESFESIHTHNVKCRLESTMGAIEEELALNSQGGA